MENKVVNVKGWNITYSRIIASWINVGGKCNYRGEFDEWLKHLGIEEAERREIKNMARNGKLEFEEDARIFRKSYNS